MEDRIDYDLRKYLEKQDSAPEGYRDALDVLDKALPSNFHNPFDILDDRDYIAKLKSKDMFDMIVDHNYDFMYDENDVIKPEFGEPFKKKIIDILDDMISAAYDEANMDEPHFDESKSNKTMKNKNLLLEYHQWVKDVYEADVPEEQDSDESTLTVLPDGDLQMYLSYEDLQDALVRDLHNEVELFYEYFDNPSITGSGWGCVFASDFGHMSDMPLIYDIDEDKVWGISTYQTKSALDYLEYNGKCKWEYLGKASDYGITMDTVYGFEEDMRESKINVKKKVNEDYYTKFEHLQTGVVIVDDEGNTFTVIRRTPNKEIIVSDANNYKYSISKDEYLKNRFEVKKNTIKTESAEADILKTEDKFDTERNKLKDLLKNGKLDADTYKKSLDKLEKDRGSNISSIDTNESVFDEIDPDDSDFQPGAEALEPYAIALKELGYDIVEQHTSMGVIDGYTFKSPTVGTVKLSIENKSGLQFNEDGIDVSIKGVQFEGQDEHIKVKSVEDLKSIFQE